MILVILCVEFYLQVSQARLVYMDGVEPSVPNQKQRQAHPHAQPAAPWFALVCQVLVQPNLQSSFSSGFRPTCVVMVHVRVTSLLNELSNRHPSTMLLRL